MKLNRKYGSLDLIKKKKNVNTTIELILVPFLKVWLTNTVLSLWPKTCDGKMQEAESRSTFSLFTTAGALFLSNGYFALFRFPRSWPSPSQAAAGSTGTAELQLSNTSTPSSWIGCSNLDLDRHFNLLLVLGPGIGERTAAGGADSAWCWGSCTENTLSKHTGEENKSGLRGVAWFFR